MGPVGLPGFDGVNASKGEMVGVWLVFNCLLVYLFICLVVYLFVYIFGYLFIFICLLICLFILFYFLVCLFICYLARLAVPLGPCTVVFVV